VQTVDLLDGALLFSEVVLVPLLPAPRLWRYVPGEDVFVADGVSMGGPCAPHPDLYLQARRIDPSDPDEVARFMSRYGSPGVDPVLASGRPTPERWRAEPPALMGLSAVDRKRGDEVRDAHLPDLGTFVIDTGASVRQGLETIGWLVDTWRLLTDEQPLDGIDGADALRFAMVLDSCIAHAAPRVTFDRHVDDPDFVDYLAPRPPLLAVMGVQLAAHIARRTRWKTCLGCGVLFEFPERSGKADRHPRSDAKYHDDDCGRRARDRKSKRKRRAERRGDRGSSST
jgi:hypothetical protein